MVIAITPTPVPYGHCSHCGRVWTLEIRQGICQWCDKPASCQNSTSKPRRIKSRSKSRQKQTDGNGNGYNELQGKWHTYYRIASFYSHKAKPQDREDLLQDIMIALADVERNNGHKPYTEATMYRIASRAVFDYWRERYRHNNGLDCRWCSKIQQRKCKENWVYPYCPKAIKLESLNKPIMDSDGNITELGELIADPESLDLDVWERDTSLWQLGYKPRLVDIAQKLKAGTPLDWKDYKYLQRYRQKEQKKLFQDVQF